jgi:hypothetical protein
MMLSLIAAALIGPNFIDTINETDDKFNLTYDVVNTGIINSPLELWFSFSGNPSNLSGELSHNSVSYSLFDNYNPTASPISISPLSNFIGENANGKWKLKIESNTSFTVLQWGISTIPEPSTFSLLLIGSMLFFFKKNT